VPVVDRGARSRSLIEISFRKRDLATDWTSFAKRSRTNVIIMMKHRAGQALTSGKAPLLRHEDRTFSRPRVLVCAVRACIVISIYKYRQARRK